MDGMRRPALRLVCTTGRTVGAVGCQAEWADLVLWVQARGAGTPEATGGWACPEGGGNGSS